MYKHLKERAYYDDLYDQFTVEECLSYERIQKQRQTECTSKEEAAAAECAHKLMIWAVTGERYKDKAAKIEQWMERDRRKDEMIEQTFPPNDVLCLDCGIYMDFESKHLHSERSEDKERVLFMMRCKECRKGKAVFEDSSEWKRPQERCPDCRGELQSKHGRMKDRLTTEYTCPNCFYGRCDWLDMKSSNEEPSEKEKRRYRIDRDRFCLSAKDGMEYVDQIGRIKYICDEMGDKDTWSAKKAAKELEKLSVKAIEKKIASATKKAGYEKLRLQEPQVGKDIVVEFKVQDAKEERDAYDSKCSLKKTIKQALQHTNWRLMSEGVDYRLGILSGRLRGYENENDLVALVENKRKTQ